MPVRRGRGSDADEREGRGQTGASQVSLLRCRSELFHYRQRLPSWPDIGVSSLPLPTLLPPPPPPPPSSAVALSGSIGRVLAAAWTGRVIPLNNRMTSDF